MVRDGWHWRCAFESRDMVLRCFDARAWEGSRRRFPLAHSVLPPPPPFRDVVCDVLVLLLCSVCGVKRHCGHRTRLGQRASATPRCAAPRARAW
jgi:hypothetical protein